MKRAFCLSSKLLNPDHLDRASITIGRDEDGAQVRSFSAQSH